VAINGAVLSQIMSNNKHKSYAGVLGGGSGSMSLPGNNRSTVSNVIGDTAYADAAGKLRCGNCHLVDCPGNEVCQMRRLQREQAVERTSVGETDGYGYLVLFSENSRESAKRELGCWPRVGAIKSVAETSQLTWSDVRYNAVLCTVFVDDKARVGGQLVDGSLFPRSILSSITNGVILG